MDRIAGPQMAVAIMLFGEETVGQHLVDLGLAREAHPDDEVDKRGLELARRVASRHVASRSPRVTHAELVRTARGTFRA